MFGPADVIQRSHSGKDPYAPIDDRERKEEKNNLNLTFYPSAEYSQVLQNRCDRQNISIWNHWFASMR